jgi:hypothetical protein
MQVWQLRESVGLFPERHEVTHASPCPMQLTPQLWTWLLAVPFIARVQSEQLSHLPAPAGSHRYSVLEVTAGSAGEHTTVVDGDASTGSGEGDASGVGTAELEVAVGAVPGAAASAVGAAVALPWGGVWTVAPVPVPAPASSTGRYSSGAAPLLQPRWATARARSHAGKRVFLAAELTIVRLQSLTSYAFRSVIGKKKVLSSGSHPDFTLCGSIHSCLP